MIYLEVGNLFGFVVMVYLVMHLPAFILLLIGIVRWKHKRESAKKFLIAALVYFIVGAGVCGSMAL